MATSYLIDSNVLIDYVGRKFNTSIEEKLDNIFDHSFNYSVISQIEVLGYNATPSVLLNLEKFLSLGNCHYLNDEVCQQTIQIRRLLPKSKLPDLVIASTALIHNYCLLTRNVDDFKTIPNLNYINPWTWPV